MISCGITFAQAPGILPDPPSELRGLVADLDVTPEMFALRVTDIPPGADGALELRTLTLDDMPLLPDLPGASTQWLDQTAPGRLVGTQVSITNLLVPVEAGVTYHLSYDILDLSGALALAVAADGPFEATALPAGIGRHNVILTATRDGLGAVLTLSGDATFGQIGLQQALWRIPLPQLGPDMISEPVLNEVVGSGAPVAALAASLIPGAFYDVSYEVTSYFGGELFFGSGAGSPFPYAALPSTVGVHRVVVAAEDLDISAPIRASGAGVILASVTCRKVLTGGETIAWEVGVDSDVQSGTVTRPRRDTFHVSPLGDDVSGTGSLEAPLQQPGAALARAQAGDRIYLRPGIYAPFDVTVSGAPDAPVTIGTLPGEAHQAIVDGSGVPNRPGLQITNQSHVTLRGLTVRNVTNSSGIAIENPAGLKGHHLIEDCVIHAIDQSGVRCVGIAPGQYSGTQTDIFTENVTIRGNKVYDCYRQGAPGNEVITIGGGCRNIIVEDNDIHDSLQYGIDFKRGVDGGIIRNNRIWNIEKHAIYIDSSVSFVRGLRIYGNRAWGCNNGIILAREALGQQTQILENIDVFNNVIWDMRVRGIMCYGHSGDGPFGTISGIRIRFNTVHNCANEEYRFINWAEAEYLQNGVVAGFDVIGNIAWRDGGAPAVFDSFSGKAPFTVLHNAFSDDPLFVDQAARDLRLQAASPLSGTVPAPYADAPFNTTIDTTPRTAPATPGAF